MTEETFEKADGLIRKINVHKRAVDDICQYKNRVNSLSVYINIPGEVYSGYFIAEGELMHQILDLIYSDKRKKLMELEDEFKVL